MKYQKLIQAWIKEKEWDEKVSYNKETNESTVDFQVDISGQLFSTYIEGDEKKDWLTLFMYAPFNAKKGKEAEILKLFNRIHAGTYYGRLVILDEGRIRYVQAIPFKNTEPSTDLIEDIYLTAIILFEQWMDDITEIALTKTTFDEWDAKQEAAENNAEEAPDQL